MLAPSPIPDIERSALLSGPVGGAAKDLGLECDSPPASRTRVLFVSSSSGDGGADRLPVELARALNQRGAQVVFACRAGKFTEERSRAAGIETVPFNIRNSGDLRAARQLAGLTIDGRIDILHIHARRDFMVAAIAGWIARPARRRIGLPRLRIVLHSHLIRPLGEPHRPAGWFFQAGADAVIAVSAATEAYLNHTHALRPGFVRRITNGVDTNVYAPSARSANVLRQRNSLRHAWGIGEFDVAIGMVGRLLQKGQTTLLAAASELAKTHPTLKIVLVGPERDPGDFERIKAIASRLGLSNRLTLAGARDDIPACMAAFDVLAHLPRDEAFGLVLAEAMASGLPLIATDVGGCREVIGESGRGGQLLGAGDIAALTAALLPLLDSSQGPARRAALSAESLRAAREFSRERQIDSLLALYAELCSA